MGEHEATIRQKPNSKSIIKGCLQVRIPSSKYTSQIFQNADQIVFRVSG